MVSQRSVLKRASPSGDVVLNAYQDPHSSRDKYSSQNISLSPPSEQLKNSHQVNIVRGERKSVGGLVSFDDDDEEHCIDLSETPPNRLSILRDWRAADLKTVDKSTSMTDTLRLRNLKKNKSDPVPIVRRNLMNRNGVSKWTRDKSLRSRSGRIDVVSEQSSHHGEVRRCSAGESEIYLRRQNSPSIAFLQSQHQRAYSSSWAGSKQAAWDIENTSTWTFHLGDTKTKKQQFTSASQLLSLQPEPKFKSSRNLLEDLEVKIPKENSSPLILRKRNKDDSLELLVNQGKPVLGDIKTAPVRRGHIADRLSDAVSITFENSTNLDRKPLMRQDSKESSLVRQRVLMLDGSFNSTMYGCTRKPSIDFFAPYEESNKSRMISMTELKDTQKDPMDSPASRSHGKVDPEVDFSAERKHSNYRFTKLFTRTKGTSRTARKKRIRKHEKRDIMRMIKRINQIQNNRANYYQNFFYANGRTSPWRNVFVLIIWTTIVVALHKNHWDVGRRWFVQPLTLEISSNIPDMLGIALGYLLFMQACVSSRRWWRGRIEWQMIMECNKRLTVLLNTHLTSIHLSDFGTRMIMAHTVSVQCFLQDKNNEVWHEELANILDKRTIARIMINSRRLRPLAILYGFQRVIEICIRHRLLPKEVVRDINPILVSLTSAFDACNRSRIAQFPWVMAIHLNFVVFIFLLMVPLTLVADRSLNQDGVYTVGTSKSNASSIGVYGYVFLLSYCYFGLYQMAVDIEDPFSYKRENFSFGLWGLWEYWTAIEMSDIRQIFGFRMRKNQEGKINATGDYGEYWSVQKLEPHIIKAANANKVKNSKQVLKQLKRNRRNPSYWEKFQKSCVQEDSSSSFYFSTASDNDDVDDRLKLNEHSNESLSAPESTTFKTWRTDNLLLH